MKGERGKNKPLKIKYIYKEPKTKEERAEAEQNLQRAYDVLFDATVNSEEWKQYLARTRKKRGK